MRKNQKGAQTRLTELGCKSSRDRWAQLEPHIPEMIRLVQECHSINEVTRRIHHCDHRTLKNHGIDLTDYLPEKAGGRSETKKKPQTQYFGKRVFSETERVEIQAHLTNFGLEATRKNYHTGSSTLESNGFKWEKRKGKRISLTSSPKLPAEEKPSRVSPRISPNDVVIPEFSEEERLLERLLEILNFLRNALQESKKVQPLLRQVEVLTRELTEAKKQLAKLEEDLKAARASEETVTAQARQILEQAEAALGKVRTKTIPLADLQHYKGRGFDGKRRSYKSGQGYSFEKPQSPDK